MIAGKQKEGGARTSNHPEQVLFFSVPHKNPYGSHSVQYSLQHIDQAVLARGAAAWARCTPCALRMARMARLTESIIARDDSTIYSVVCVCVCWD